MPLANIVEQRRGHCLLMVAEGSSDPLCHIKRVPLIDRLLIPEEPCLSWSETGTHPLLLGRGQPAAGEDTEEPRNEMPGTVQR